jgi:hypothetical protein
VRAPIPEDDLEDLPNVDDLAIAAGAAAGVPDPVGPILRRVLGEESDEEDEQDATPESKDMQLDIPTGGIGPSEACKTHSC